MIRNYRGVSYVINAPEYSESPDITRKFQRTFLVNGKAKLSHETMKIKDFHYTFEMAWKYIKSVAKTVGYDCRSPRECLKLAYKMGWIKNEEEWLSLLEARNLTSHTYDQETALGVYETVKENVDAYGSLLKELRNEL